MEQGNPPRRKRRSIYQRNRRTQGILLACLLLVFVLLFDLLGYLTPDRSYSEQENRKLAVFPPLRASALSEGSWFSDFDSYFADQFPARDFWISLQLQFSRWMGATESNGVLLCDGHYLMEQPVAPGAQQLADTLAALRAFAGQHSETNMLLCVAPNAAAILPEKLPAQLPVRDQLADLRALAADVEGLRFVDVSDALLAQKDTQLYYRTDHHWTTRGAACAFEALAPAMGLETAGMQYTVYPVSTTFEGTLASRSGCHEVRDTVELWIPETEIEYYVTYEDSATRTCSLYSPDALSQKDHYTVFFGGNHPRVDITTTAETGKCLLLFKDSYANCMVQLMTPYYEKIILIDPRYYYGDVDSLIRREGITDVLFLYNANTFFEDTSLAELLTVGD